MQAARARKVLAGRLWRDRRATEQRLRAGVDWALAKAIKACEKRPMFRMINRTTLAFMGVFLIACVAALVYHVFFVWPRQDCDQRGAWWDSKDRQCATPMEIWRITGRTVARGPANPGAPAPSASIAAPAAKRP